MQTILMNTKNSNTTDSHKFVFNLSQRSDLRSSDKLVALQDLPIYYMWKNIKKQYNNNKLKIIAPTWINEFELPDGLPFLSYYYLELPYYVSDIQYYTEFIVKKHETLTTIPHIYVYINRINNRLVFKIKDKYKLELQTPETMKLFGSIKN